MLKSVGEARRQLPSEFVEQLYGYFPALLADKILHGYTQHRLTSLRVNTIKTSVRDVMQSLRQENIKFDRVLWWNNALIVKNSTERHLKQLSCYKKGEIYLQSLSSMLPPLILRPKTTDYILDLAAAPGGKTTQMAAMMNNRGQILAVELKQIRYQRLVYNIEKQGITNVKAICADGTRMGNIYPNIFDKVLVDAPCSGEGLFSTSNSHTYRAWKRKLINNSLKIQRRLLTSAILATKPGGLILYSTCTMNPEENEFIIDQALDLFPNQIEVQEINLKIHNSIPGFTAVDNKQLNPALALSLRIIPDQQFEGFFCCLLRKSSQC